MRKESAQAAIPSLEPKIEGAQALLQQIARDYAPAVLASSFGAEDMVLLDLIHKSAPTIEVFTLDTGRLPEETHRLMEQVKERYGLLTRIYYPQAPAVEEYVRTHGTNAFYQSVELRLNCCHIRKVEPLRRALAGKKAWITGMRRQQSTTRGGLALSEWDTDNNLHKFSPLVDWTQNEVWAYIHRFEVPYNALHDQGYASIGCAPCTRAITVGEDIRAGRWWWEQPASKECGLHIKKAAK